MKCCPWALTDPLNQHYHDSEWGIPVHDDRLLFEFLVLEGAQAGLSWITILKRREGYRKAFDGFFPEIIASYSAKKQAELLQDTSIIRNRLKVQSAVKNAKAFLQVQQEFGSFDRYIWQFTGGKPIQNCWQEMKEIPAETPESQAMSKNLKKRGFTFVGPTICYAFMQAVGMVNDHLVHCFRYQQLDK